MYSQIIIKNNGLLSGNYTKTEDFVEFAAQQHPPLLETFLNDDNIQEMTVVSTSVGFVTTYTKVYAER
ncbi:hypothetical protein [Chroococcidiopsis sp.]|uniref:hypothetical protein n=1 Tax=Chroococcidiopsis sp. TaxID=3088168 RepID=UPI003F361F3B